MKNYVAAYDYIFLQGKAIKNHCVVRDKGGHLKNRKELHNGDTIVMEQEDVDYILEKMRLLPTYDNPIEEQQHIFEFICNNARG